VTWSLGGRLARRGKPISGVSTKRSLKSLAAVATTAVFVIVGTPTPTSAAEYVSPQVAWTGVNINVSPDGSTAYINGKYNCVGGRTGTHLWVSVKQGPGLDDEHTSSSDADAWYDTNWNFENSETGLTVDCDGHWHVTRYELRQEFGELVDGTAFVQFCLFDNTSTDDNFPQGFVFDYSWKTVRVP
jgi:hypothetical protein